MNDSDEMSDSNGMSLVAPSDTSARMSPNTRGATVQHSSQDYFTGVASSQPDHDMVTDDPPNQHKNKRKRSDAGPEELSTPVSARSFTSPLLQNPPPNQLGISYSGLANTPPSNSPAYSRTTLPHLPLGTNISTALLQNDMMTSTPKNLPQSRQVPPTNGKGKSVPTHPSPAQVKDVDVTGFIDDSPLIGLDPRVSDNWKSIPGRKAFAYPHDAAYSEDDKTLIGERMEQAIAHHLNGQSPVVTAPRIAPNYEAKSRRPWCYLVSRLSEESLNIILKEGFIANQHAVLHIIPFTPDPSHYIGRIKNLTLDTNLHQSVVKLIQSSISEDTTTMNYICDFVVAHHDLIPKEVTIHRNTVDWLLNSIRAYHIQKDGQIGKAYSQWKWYIFTPTKNREHAEQWARTLAKVTFNAGIFGFGETTTDTRCTRCKSTNHVDSECPFTKRSQFVPSPPSKRPSNSTRGNRGQRKGNACGAGRGRT